MMDSELKKSSVRANSLEKKRFEMMMSAFDSAKRNVAVDMKKSQLDFKRRLKRYKDRQREILVTRSGPSSSSMEEFVLKRLTRRSYIHPTLYGIRPQTSPHPQGTLRFRSGRSDIHGPAKSTITSSSSRRAAALQGNPGNSTAEEEDEELGKLSHCRRSKVDLRPCTAWSADRNAPSCRGEATTTMTSTSSLFNPQNGLKLLQLRGGSLGSPAKQVRYLDDEEIEERSTFYRFLLDGFRHLEHQRLEILTDRVEQFCGKEVSRQPSGLPLRKVGVVSLPAGVPPIIVQAMRVKIPPVNVLGQMQRAKTQ